MIGDDHGGFDNFVCFGISGDLVVSGWTNDYIVVGSSSVNNKKSKAPYKTKANAGETNKWVCLSIHWENHTTPSANNISVYCNGQKLTEFQSRTSLGSSQMTFGGLNPNSISPFKGDMTFVSVYKGRIINENDILLHHHVLSRWSNIDTVDFSF